MPSETLSPRKGTRLVSSRARFIPGLLIAICLVLLCPLACASNPPPQVFGPTRDKLAALDEFGALLVKAGLPPELLPTGFEVSEVGNFYRHAEDSQWRHVEVPSPPSAAR